MKFVANLGKFAQTNIGMDKVIFQDERTSIKFWGKHSRQFFVTFLGWLYKWPLSEVVGDLQPGDKKGHFESPGTHEHLLTWQEKHGKTRVRDQKALKHSGNSRNCFTMERCAWTTMCSPVQKLIFWNKNLWPWKRNPYHGKKQTKHANSWSS